MNCSRHIANRIQVSALVLLSGVLLTTNHLLAAKKSSLSPQYQRWIDRDVAYIITKEEADEFRRLTSDEERDRFIQNFWEVRNPTPGAPTNPYKDEIYRRIQYANENFGPRHGDVGWRTDMGRVYITLGEPQQRAKYYEMSQTRPMEIWFYQNANPALPPYFYILFYQREIGGDFRLYSPYFDGPDKLTTSSLSVNDRLRAFKLIDQELGREVARVTLSLIPNEPVDTNGATSSMESDLMLSVLKTLANNPLTKERLRRNRDLLANVNSRIIIPGDYLDVATAILRDSAGETNVHYVVRYRKPTDFSLGKEGDRYFYSFELGVQVFDRDNKLLLEDRKTLSDYVSSAEFERMKSAAFGIEGMLPLPPGNYRLEWLLNDKLRKTAYTVVRKITVPDSASKAIQISDAVPFWEIHRVGSAVQLPFTFSGVSFTPQSGEQASVMSGEDLRVMYQVWLPPGDPAINRGKKLDVEYRYGRLASSADTHTIHDEITREQFDLNGSLITGTHISTVGLPGGNYRLLIAVSDLETHQTAYTGINFRITDQPVSRPWDLTIANTSRKADEAPEYQRAMVYLGQGNQDSALKWLQRVRQSYSLNETVRARLADLYFARQDFASVLSLYNLATFSTQTDDHTVLQVVESEQKLGSTSKAIETLETAISLRKPTPPLYLMLASLYESVGNEQKAAELREKGRLLSK